MRKLLLMASAAAMCVMLLTFAQSIPNAMAAGAVQSPIDSNWDGSSDSNGDGLWGPLASPIGKVVYVVPDGRKKLIVTYIAEGAIPNTAYTVGFNIFTITSGCGDVPTTFGVPVDVNCAAGTVGGHYDIARVFKAGTLTTDANGDGDFHINLNNLPSGTYSAVFWLVPCSPPGACGYFPTASTGSWGIRGTYETVEIP